MDLLGYPVLWWEHGSLKVPGKWIWLTPWRKSSWFLKVSKSHLSVESDTSMLLSRAVTSNPDLSLPAGSVTYHMWREHEFSCKSQCLMGNGSCNSPHTWRRVARCWSLCHHLTCNYRQEEERRFSPCDRHQYASKMIPPIEHIQVNLSQHLILKLLTCPKEVWKHPRRCKANVLQPQHQGTDGTNSQPWAKEGRVPEAHSRFPTESVSSGCTGPQAAHSWTQTCTLREESIFKKRF